MDSFARKAAVALLAGSALGCVAVAGDRPRRELPENAVQPPGHSYEEEVTGAQKIMLLRDTLHSTVAEVARRPVRTTLAGARRLGERLGVRLAESTPGPALTPRHQSPEAGGPCTPARITLLYDSQPAHKALLDQIALARIRIDFMMFSWDDDDAGRGVAAALIAKARSGIPVRVMIDRGAYVSGAGNAKVARGEPTFVDALKAEPNIHVIETPDPCLVFDHRKLAVIDGRIAWTGGMILTEPATALKRWHNFAFLAEGPIVPQYAALFNERWEDLGGCRTPKLAPQSGTDPEPNAVVRMIRTDIGHRTLKEAVYGAVDSARHHIYLENPYFSDQILVKKLVAARARGVDVRAIVTMRGDVPVMNKFVAITSNHLFRGGVRVYLYPAMTHVKAMSVDGRLAYIGTGNFDGAKPSKQP